MMFVLMLSKVDGFNPRTRMGCDYFSLLDVL